MRAPESSGGLRLHPALKGDAAKKEEEEEALFVCFLLQ